MAYLVKANPRTETGKSRMRRLRRAGSVPAVMYGHGEPSQMLEMNAHEFKMLLKAIRGHSPIVELELDEGRTRCVIKTIQRNPVTDELLHVDFQKVHADEKITMHVPVLLQGTAAGVKAGGLLDHILREVPVRATIDRVPEHFVIDISELQMGQSVHIKDLPAEGVEFTLPTDSPVISILAPRKIAEPTPGVAAEAAPTEEGGKEPEVIKEKSEAEEPEAKKEKK